MAEHLERRPKQSKVFSESNLNPHTNLQSEDDLMGQTGRKKGRPPKGSARMNPTPGLSVSHQPISSSEASSKTVAAILKQQKDSRLPDDAVVMRQQLSAHLTQGGKKSSHSKGKAGSKLADKTHFGKNAGSPAGGVMVGSPAMASLSPAMSPSGSQGVLSPPSSTKDLIHPVTTKSSSLSRDLSPSRITAQIVKVMADTTTTNPTPPNLLLSALQGNMPDPMGILSTSKTEGGFISVATTAGATGISAVSVSSIGSNNNLVSVNRKSPAEALSSSSSLQQQRNAFSSMLTSMAGVNSFLAQPADLDLDERDSTQDSISLLNQSHQSTVDLLTAPSGSMQTVNVSHTPKSTNPQGFNSGGSSPSAAASSASSPRSAARSAMEVAQQIKMEANGQSANAQRAALRPGMQQQLRSQIKSSRSIDAQLASRQNQGGVGAFASTQANPTSSHHRQPNKESDQQKTLEASMPLLASKLSSLSSETAHIANTSIGQPQHHRQQQQPPVLPGALDSLSLHSKSSLASSSSPAMSLSSPSLASSLAAAASSSGGAFSSLSSVTAGRRTAGSSPFSHLKSGVEPSSWQQQQQQRSAAISSHTQLQKQLQQQHQQPSTLGGLNLNFLNQHGHGMLPATTTEPHPIGVDPSWLIEEAISTQTIASHQQQPSLTTVSRKKKTTVNDFLGLVGSSDNSSPATSHAMSKFVNVGERTVQTDAPLRVEGQAQTQTTTGLVNKNLVTKHLQRAAGQSAVASLSSAGGSSSSGTLQVGAVASQLNQAPNVSKGKQLLSQSIQPVGIGGLSQGFISQQGAAGAKRSSSGGTVSAVGFVAEKKQRKQAGVPGESKQTAIDVDFDFGGSLGKASSSSSLTRGKNVSSLTMGNSTGGVISNNSSGNESQQNTDFQQQQFIINNSSSSSSGVSYRMSDSSVLVRDITGTSSSSSLASLGGAGIVGAGSSSSSISAAAAAAASIDLQSFLPIQSPINSATTTTTTSSLMTISGFNRSSSGVAGGSVTQVTSTLAQIPRPIMHIYSSPSSLASANSSSMAASASAGSTSSSSSSHLPPPPDYNAPHPPPPYPSKKQQQQLQQQQQFQNHHHHNQHFLPQQQESHSHSRVVPNPKESIPNPFTFPTTGVKVQSDPHDLIGHLTYSLSSSHHSTDNVSSKSAVGAIGSSGLSNNLKEFQQQQQMTFSSGRVSSRATEKSRSDISTLGRSPREQFSRLGMDGVNLPPNSLSASVGVKAEVKTEVDGSLHNHVGYPVKNEQVDVAQKIQLVQPFNQRVANLSCLGVTNTAYRAAYRSHSAAVQRARSGVITNTAKSLDVLRQNLQKSINKEITEIIKKYRDRYFEPALSNIRENSNEGLLGNEHINHVCRQILEDAKSEFSSVNRRSVTPTVDITDNTSETGSINGRRTNNARRGRISDSDSEKGSEVGSIRRPAKRKGRAPHGSGRLTPSKPLKSVDAVKREGPKWDPDRITHSTQFVMGARANKALGLGNTRGRLYIRHPDVFKYVGDPEDKVWLHDHGLMPPTGGKAYLLLLEDIQDLSRSDEYKDSPGLLMHECIGFQVPDWMTVKMKEQMRAQRAESQKRSRSRSPIIGNEDSRPRSLPFSSFTEIIAKEEVQASPADTEDMEFLSTVDNDDPRPPSAISPFNVGSGFEEASSISPSELDAMEEHGGVHSIFA